MSLSKPVRHCPPNCRGCATFAAFGGERFPDQPPGSPLAKCYEYAKAAGIIGGPSSATADLVPAPLSIPVKSVRRPIGKPLPLFSGQISQSREEALVRAAAIETLTAADATADADAGMPRNSSQSGARQATTPKAPTLNLKIDHLGRKAGYLQTDRRSRSSPPPYSGINYDVDDPRYPLGHAYIPPCIDPLPSDPMFTITTNGEQHATTFVGRYAMRMYDAYRASGVDMRTYEVRGEWEKLGAKRWIFSLGVDTDMGKVKKVLGKGKDAAMAVGNERTSTSKLLREYENMGIAVEGKRLEMENAFRDVEKAVEGGEWGRRPLVDGPLNTKAMQAVIKEIIKLRLDPLDFDGPDWIGGTTSISPLPPRQRPLRVVCGTSGVMADDEDGETACTTYVRLAPMKQMDFSWYQRRNTNDRRHQWSHYMRCIMKDGTIRDFPMKDVNDSVNGRFSSLKKRFVFEESAAKFALTFVWSQWRKMAREMTKFEWFWDEDKRILVQGYSGHHDYEKDCDWIDEQMSNWKDCVEDDLEANRKAVKSGSLSKKEAKYAMTGGQLLRQWKEGPGIMISRTPSDEKWEGSILGPHTNDGSSHINYLNSRIAFATRQKEEIEKMWATGSATEEDLAERRELVEYIDVLETLKDDIREQKRQEETGLSPIFKDKHTKRQVHEWERECREEMRLWEREPREGNNEQNLVFEESGTPSKAHW